MKISKEDKEILKFIEKQINNSLNFMNSKPFRCSMYLLKYIYDE